jgi:hypothetical protein
MAAARQEGVAGQNKSKRSQSSYSPTAKTQLAIQFEARFIVNE